MPETNVSTEPNAHTGNPFNLAVARSFGVIGIYDGHLAGVGRVIVDSTWHHFFDINLIGDPAAPAGPKLGFNASVAALAMILRPDRTFTATELNHTGGLAWDNIVQSLPPCTLVQITLPSIVVPLLPTPWRPGPPDPGPLTPIEDIARLLLGHIVSALGQSRQRLASNPPLPATKPAASPPKPPKPA